VRDAAGGPDSDNAVKSPQPGRMITETNFLAETFHARSVISFRQEKSFHDHALGWGPAAGIQPATRSTTGGLAGREVYCGMRVCIPDTVRYRAPVRPWSRAPNQGGVNPTTGP
jgi:hypothetical protein